MRITIEFEILSSRGRDARRELSVVRRLIGRDERAVLISVVPREMTGATFGTGRVRAHAFSIPSEVNQINIGTPIAIVHADTKPSAPAR